MLIQSLGFKTEMIFHRFDGIIADRGAYIVVKTPSNPGFFFGNLLLFLSAPKAGSLRRWKETFLEEFKDTPGVKHFTFCWDSPKEGAGDVSELQAEGYKVEFSVVLTARSVHPPKKFNPIATIRPISTDAEWKQVTENQIISKSQDFKEEEYRLFKELQMARYRAMAEQGIGQWFGAFLDGKLVGDLPLFQERCRLGLKIEGARSEA